MRAIKPAVRVVEAAYRWSKNEAEWLQGVVDAASSYDVEAGVLAYTVALDAKPRVVSTGLKSGTPREPVVALTALTRAFSPKVAHAMYQPTEFAGNAGFRFARVARETGTTARAIERRAGHRMPPVWAVVAGDPARHVAVLAFVARRSLKPDQRYPSRERARQLGMIGAHIGAALRLRETVAAASPDDAATEAVLTPGGRVLHATGDAVAERRSIIDSVLAIERARLKSVPDEEGLALWNALVEGRWSIVDIVERDGKRLLLARKNELNARPDILSLSDLERDVTWLSAMGHSYKYIAYELGISPSKVVRRLESAMKKLRLRSRSELLRAFSSRAE